MRQIISSILRMVRHEIIGLIKNLPIVLLIIGAGICAYIISIMDPALDALFMALLLGIIFGSFFKEQKKEKIAQKALSVAPTNRYYTLWSECSLPLRWRTAV